jgi:hypothetical protein
MARKAIVEASRLSFMVHKECEKNAYDEKRVKIE